MKGILSMAMLCILALGGRAQNIIEEFDLFYKSGSFELTDEHKSELETFRGKLSNIPEAYEVSIEGHTDNTGDNSFNQSLSEKRAKAVGLWMNSNGFKVRDEALTGYADGKPIASNRSWREKAKNRRVTIKLGLKKLKPADVFGFDIPTEVVEIDASKDSKFTASNGIEISVPANSLVDKNGRLIKGKVKMKVKAFANKADFLLGGVRMDFTPGDQRQFLSSEGMLDLTASQNGQEVSIGEGQSVGMNIPMPDSVSGVDLWRFDYEQNIWVQIDMMGRDLNQVRAFRELEGCDGGCPPQRNAGI